MERSALDVSLEGKEIRNELREKETERKIGRESVCFERERVRETGKERRGERER